MNAKLIKTAFLILMIAIMHHQNILAQENTPDETSKLMVGLGIDLLAPNDLYFFTPTAPHLLILFDINRSFRIEPEIGFYNTKEFDSYYSSQTDRSGITLGMGLYLKKELKQINFYGGIKSFYGISLSLSERNTQEYDSKRFNVGPLFGLEYVFGKQFSIGGDFIANYHNTKIFHSNDNTGEFEDWNKGISIVKSLKLRFYF